jgi:copper chaperone NosL
MTTSCNCRRRDWLGLAALGALGAIGSIGALSLAGCGDRTADAQASAPKEFAADTACELDGMTLADYPGPKAQIHYADAAGAAAPMFLCDTVELFSTLLQPEQVRKVQAAYVQDMGRADWDQPRGNWIDARGALFVRGSKRLGSMGPTLASFAQEADAKKFVGEYGGTVLRYGEITPAMVDLGGGSKGDTKM